jgi:hypothetical protein
MNLQFSGNFRVIDDPEPTETIGQWRIINYGEPSLSSASAGFLEERTLVSSGATPFEFKDSYSKGSICFVTSGTSSFTNVEIPESPWFITDRINRIIVFPKRVRLPKEMTWAYREYVELPQTNIARQFNPVFQRIGKLARLPENWDSYGARPVCKNSISRGVILLKELIELRSTIGFEIPVPFVAPLSSGGIQIEWEKGEKYLELSITSDPPTVEYFAADKVKEGQLTLEGSLRSASGLKELISWFVNGSAEDLAHFTFEESPEASIS